MESLTQHTAILVPGQADRKLLIQSVLNGKFDQLLGVTASKTTVYADYVLNEFLQDEDKYGVSDLTIFAGRSVLTMSSGEQKKAFFDYCTAGTASYLIVDNIFDSLDAQSVEKYKEKLVVLADQVSIIQLYNRQADVLPCCNRFLTVKVDSSYTQRFWLQADSIQKFEPTVYEWDSLPIEPNATNTWPQVFVSIKNVSVQYQDKPILNQINWQITKGQHWQLIGPNGSGKSTLLSMILGQNPKAYHQDITIFGIKKGSGESIWDHKKNIGYFAASMTSLFARTTTVQEMVVSGLFDSIGLYTIPSERQLRLANKWIKVLNISELSQKLFHKISLAQQRLVMIARAMIKNPPLLILDEPCTGLNDTQAQMVCSLIQKIMTETETTVIFVSHRSEPFLQADKILELVVGEHGAEGRVY